MIVRKPFTELTNNDVVLFWEDREIIKDSRRVEIKTGYWMFVYLGTIDHLSFFRDMINGNVVTKDNYYYQSDRVLIYISE